MRMNEFSKKIFIYFQYFISNYIQTYKETYIGRGLDFRLRTINEEKIMVFFPFAKGI